MSFNWLYTVQERVMQPPPSLSVFLFYFSFLLFNFKIIFPFQFQRYWHETRNKYKGEILLKVFGIFFFLWSIGLLLTYSYGYFHVNIDSTTKPGDRIHIHLLLYFCIFFIWRSFGKEGNMIFQCLCTFELQYLAVQHCVHLFHIL